MDYENTQIRFPTLSEFNENLKSSIDDSIRKIILKLLHSIAQGEDLSVDYLISTYGNILDNITIDSVVRKQRKTIPSDNRCLAKINNNRQCSRKRKGVQYCGGHIERRPHGEFNDNTHQKNIDTKKNVSIIRKDSTGTEDHIDEDVNDNIDEDVNDNIDEAVNDNIDEAVNDNIDEAVNDNIDEAVNDNIDDVNDNIDDVNNNIDDVKNNKDMFNDSV